MFFLVYKLERRSSYRFLALIGVVSGRSEQAAAQKIGLVKPPTAKKDPDPFVYEPETLEKRNKGEYPEGGKYLLNKIRELKQPIKHS